MSWLDALLGRIWSHGDELELAGGIEFLGDLEARRNDETNRIEVEYSTPYAGESVTLDTPGVYTIAIPEHATTLEYELMGPGGSGGSGYRGAPGTNQTGGGGGDGAPGVVVITTWRGVPA